MRDVTLGSDTQVYFNYFDSFKNKNDLSDTDRIEFGFYYLSKLISYITDSKVVYLSIIFLIQFVGLTSSIYKKNIIFKPYILVSLIWLSFPFFYSITLNVIRQGLAFVFVVYALDFILRNEKKLAYLFLLLGASFHYSTLLYIPCFLILEFNIKFRTLVGLWLFSISLSYLNLTEKLLINFLSFFVGSDAYYASYLDSSVNEDYVAGFKISFLIFSSIPIGYYYITKKIYPCTLNNIEYLFKIYLIMNSIYFIFSSLPYSDRFAISSWLLMPYLINYSFLNKVGILNYFKASTIVGSIILFSYYTIFT